jgi:hypothetical protein
MPPESGGNPDPVDQAELGEQVPEIIPVAITPTRRSAFMPLGPDLGGIFFLTGFL